ncbi:MAG: MFS transporter [Beijerinckiaceae bacterium]
MAVTFELAGGLSARGNELDSPRAWMRLAVAVLLGTIGGVGMWSVPVVLPAVQVEFAADRAGASLPYTLTMVGFAFGGIAFGRLADRFGVMAPVIAGAITLGCGYVVAGYAPSLPAFALAQGVLVGFGSAATFGPLIADISHWFVRRRGIAVAICAAGNYVAGTIWPSTIQHFVEVAGWHATYVGIGLFCGVTMPLLALALRRKPPGHGIMPSVATPAFMPPDIGVSSRLLQILLCVAGVSCCVAMAMPQVHIVAYCGDLGYGAARGAEMLALMLGFGIISRVGSGFVADRIGGVATLLLSSVLQGLSLTLFLFFDGLGSLYVISALFGLFQGGIVPSYAIIVREMFSPREAGGRLGIVLMATLGGMALGGWMSGLIFDLTGSYRIAFFNGLAWNLLNGSIALWLLLRQGGLSQRRPSAARSPEAA